MDDNDVYWDAGFTYGELKCERCGCVLSANADDDYTELADRAKRLGWLVEYMRPGLLVRCPACGANHQAPIVGEPRFKPGWREFAWGLIAVALLIAWWFASSV